MDLMSLAPFRDTPWRGAALRAAGSLWAWHEGLREAAAGSATGASGYDGEKEYLLAMAGQPVSVVSREIAEAAYETARQHDLDFESLARQARAVHHLRSGCRFETMADLESVVSDWALPLGRQLGALSGIRSSWQMDFVDAFSRAVFHLRHLVRLPADLGGDRLFLPLDELNRFGLEAEDLRVAPPGEGARRLIWKQCVRIREAFSRARPLSRDLPRRASGVFRAWWIGSLELVNEIERRDFDLWSRPLSLSLYHRAQAAFQARFSRVSFRRA